MIIDEKTYISKRCKNKSLAVAVVEERENKLLKTEDVNNWRERTSLEH